MTTTHTREMGELAKIDLNDIRLSTADESESDAESSMQSTSANATVTMSLSAPGTYEDDDAPPAFPSLNSAQRQRPSSQNDSGSRTKVSAFLESVAPPKVATNGLMPPPGNASSGRAGGLALPPSTTALTAPLGVGGASGIKAGTEKKRKKVALAPGCSPLDWARLKNSTDLRGGVTSLMKVTPTELKKHNTREDAWSVFYGKVYNITPYLRFHPGGEDELMRVAGRDGTRLFALTHSWVNIDAMIDTAMVGVLTSDG